MYRVLLPEGGLVVSSHIDLLCEYVESEDAKSTMLRLVNSSKDVENANAIYIHFKRPVSTLDGVFIGCLCKDEMEDIKHTLLEKGYFDFTKFNYCTSATDMLDCDRPLSYYYSLTESEFEGLLIK